jgi:hypothetical protein
LILRYFENAVIFYRPFRRGTPRLLNAVIRPQDLLEPAESDPVERLLRRMVRFWFSAALSEYAS